MKKILLLLGILMTQYIYSQTTTTVKVIQNSQFGLTYFVKNVDSLKRERAIIDSLLRISDAMKTIAFTQIDRYNALIRWHKKHPNTDLIDSVTVLANQFHYEDSCHAAITSLVNIHVPFFNKLLPRITERLQKYVTDYSTKSNQISIDWSTYNNVHDEFISWGQEIINNHNINVGAMNRNSELVANAINSIYSQH